MRQAASPWRNQFKHKNQFSLHSRSWNLKKSWKWGFGEASNWFLTSRAASSWIVQNSDSGWILASGSSCGPLSTSSHQFTFSLKKSVSAEKTFFSSKNAMRDGENTLEKKVQSFNKVVTKLSNFQPSGFFGCMHEKFRLKSSSVVWNWADWLCKQLHVRKITRFCFHKKTEISFFLKDIKTLFGILVAWPAFYAMIWRSLPKAKYWGKLEF